MERELRHAPWLPSDRGWRWSLGLFHIRFEKWGKRLELIPGISLDWESGMFTVAVTWIFFALSFDYEYDPDWENSEEAERIGVKHL
jgi:hypothetical protein